MSDDETTMPYLREGLIALAFLLIVAAGVFSVAIPELSDEPEKEDSTEADAGV